jgi:Nucleotidyl transferase AbiEii toxin, Type IV TA system
MTDRPRSSKEFQRLLQRYASDIDQLPQRVMHLVRVGVVCAMLDDVRHEDGRHLFIVKGGTAMQLRLGIEARATTDLDVAFRGRFDDWLAPFDGATNGSTWNGFTVARKSEPMPIEIPGSGYTPWRVPLQVRYEGREFGTITFEVAIDETSADHHELIAPDDIHLAMFSIEAPGLVPCLDVPYQIAQKLHACTEPRADGNDRVRDVIDIWLLEAFLGADDLIAVRDAATETFARRKVHSWPPRVEASPSWERDYPRLAATHAGAPVSIEDAVAYLADLIGRIDGAG